MKFVADPAAASWLEDLCSRPPEFEWDAGNRTKSAKHGVAIEEVETILRHAVLFAGRITEPHHDELRWSLLGRDDRRRRLALVFTRRGDRLRPISCRPMRRQERRVYEEAILQGVGEVEE